MTNPHTAASPVVHRSPILRYFRWDHLPKHLQEVSAKFAALAHEIDALPDGAEKSVALRKLLESKDAAVRAALPPEPAL